MNSVGDAFGYPFRDPGWVGKILVQGLILIIPIVGWIAAVGWLMLTYENLRAGRQELAPAGFHLEKGIGLFGVYLIYAVLINVPGWILDVIGSAASNQGAYAGAPFSALGSLYGFLAQLFLYFLTPTLIILTGRHGFTGGLDFQRVWAMASSQMNNSVVAALVIFVGSIIGLLGIIVCCVGIFFTLIYSTAIQAGVAAWFDGMQAAPAAAPPGV